MVNRRRVLINSILGLTIAGVGVGAYASVASNSSPTAAAQTVQVTRGNLTATVTATGNAEAVTSVGVELEGASGVVRKIYVKEGQKVSKGQKLLKIDDTSARQALATAKINVRSARAQLKTTTQGQTAAELAQSNASIASARTSLANARTALRQARASYELDRSQQAELVSIAAKAVDTAEAQKRKDQEAGADANTISGDTTAIVQARNSLTQARQSRDSTLLKDRQAIESQSGQVRAAEDALNSQVAAARVAAQPARQGAIDSAQAQIDSAEVAVEEARATLAKTVLRAPAAGTVADISAVVGQSSGSSGSSSDSTGTTGGATGGTGSSTTSSASSATTTSGLVTLTDLDRKRIVASVAEADVTKVKAGQPVAVSFAATETTVDGTVTAISTEQTVTNNVVTYDVTVTLNGNAKAIRIGQSASLTITTGSVEGVLVAPSSAITTVGTRSTVTRRVNGADSTVEIETGLVGATGTEVTSGLADGDTLVVPTTSDSSGTSFPTGGGLGRLGGR